MSKPRCQITLASLCGIVAASALGLSQNTFPQAAFALTWLILLAATFGWVIRRQPFWKGFAISGATYLFLSQLLAYPPNVGQPAVMLGVHSILALILGTLVGIVAHSYRRPRNCLPSS
jgi:hypothetical protein